VSAALGAPFGGVVGASFGPALVFAGLAAVSAALVWPNRRLWPDDAAGSATARAAAPLPAAAVARRLLPMVLWSTALYAAYTYLATGLAAAGFSPAAVARAIALYGGGAILGILLGGRAADRFGVRQSGALALAGFAGCLLLLRAALGGDAAFLILGLTSAVAQLFFPAQQAGLAADFAARRASVLAWNNSALFLGIMLGSLVGGRAMAAGGFAIDLAIGAGVALAGCVVHLLVVPRRGLPRHDPITPSMLFGYDGSAVSNFRSSKSSPF
jgi:predicted MFS family arabinose efflux permease